MALVLCVQEMEKVRTIRTPEQQDHQHDKKTNPNKMKPIYRTESTPNAPTTEFKRDFTKASPEVTHTKASDMFRIC
jgi:hypothetical protein